jgi:hypothetical protein
MTNPIAGALTDGGGIAQITGSKLLKDFVADFLLSASGAFAATSIAGTADAVQAPLVVGFALANAAIFAGYRILLRWATS